MPIGLKSRLRFGDGSLNSEEAMLWEARAAFLAAVYQVQPATYWSLFPVEPGEPAYQVWRTRWDDDPRALVEWWQAKWHLTDGWLAEVAVNTLRSRLRQFVEGQTHVMPAAESGGTNERWTSPFAIPKLRHDHAAGHAFWLPEVNLHWNPTTETRHEVLSRLMAAIDVELDRIESISSQGRRTTVTSTPEHFYWLARFQDGDESKTRLAAALGMSRGSVGRTINGLAGFIDLTPRSYRSGRPKRKTARTVKPVPIRR
jgi:hypothetical protein